MDSTKFPNPEPGIFSYAQILHLLKIEFSRARRYQYPLAAVLIQIDRLDNLKELYGYQMRDMIEDQVVAAISQQSRGSDFLGKLGERLIMILPHTDSDGASTILSRIQSKLGGVTFDIDGREISVTASMGVAVFLDRSTIFFDTLIEQAEEALNKVIHRGGNGVMIYAESTDEN